MSVLTQKQIETINKLLLDNCVDIKNGKIADFSIKLSLNDVAAKDRIKITNVVLSLAPVQPSAAICHANQ